MPQTTNNPNIQSVLYHRLTYAQQKLQAPDLPLKIKAIAYVRICCNAMVKYNKVIKNTDSTELMLEKTHAPYLNLLRRLTLIHEEWWTTCMVSSDGFLMSTDEYIQTFLEVLNSFVKSQTTYQKAA